MMFFCAVETSYNMSCGKRFDDMICNTTSIHCKNGDGWTGGLDSYIFVENCKQLLKLECYTSSFGIYIHNHCCIDGINRTTGNYSNVLKGE